MQLEKFQNWLNCHQNLFWQRISLYFSSYQMTPYV